MKEGLSRVVQRRVTTIPGMGCDKNFEEDLKILSDIVETVHDFYEANHYRLENEEPNE